MIFNNYSAAKMNKSDKIEYIYVFFFVVLDNYLVLMQI